MDPALTPPADFGDLDLAPELLAAVLAQGFTEPTPIQARAIPVALAGHDLIGRARTGSGKTLAFALPLLQRLSPGQKSPSALVVAPTRELALQVCAVLDGLAPAARTVTVYGGASYTPQLQALARAVDIVVGTPGRLLDLVERGVLDLSQVRTVVLDEADEMLGLGFIDQIERLLQATPTERQTWLFSASMPEPMRHIVGMYLRDPVEVQVEDQALTVQHIDQRWMRVPARHKLETLHGILMTEDRGTALVFANTRIGCVEIADGLQARGLDVDRLHGGLPQNLRERVLQRVRDGVVRVLVATDVASRGIDIQHIGLVVNHDIPESPERYVHRIGRTARAGRSGLAVTLVTPKQKRRLRETAHTLDARIVQVAIPTTGDVARARRAALHLDVRRAAQTELGAARAQVAELLRDGRLTLEDLAAATLQLLAEHRDLSLDPATDDAQPDWVRPVSEAPAPTENLDEVQLVLPVGKRGQATAEAIVGALVAAGVPAVRVGRIRLEPGRSLVGLPRDVAQTLLASTESLEVSTAEGPVRVQPTLETTKPG